MNLRAIDDDKRLKIKYVKIRELPGPRMMVVESNNMTARVCWFTTTNIYQEQTFTWDMLEIDERDKNLTVIDSDFSELQMRQILEHARLNQPIQAIKYMRSIKGWGLKETKDYWDSNRDKWERLARIN